LRGEGGRETVWTRRRAGSKKGRQAGLRSEFEFCGWQSFPLPNTSAPRSSQKHEASPLRTLSALSTSSSVAFGRIQLLVMLKSSRRQARLTQKTKLAVSRGELDGAEVVILEDEYSRGNLNQDGVEKGEDQGTFLLHPSTI
jgi:hypothetical protein